MDNVKPGILHWFVDPSGANKPPLGLICKGKKVLIIGGRGGARQAGQPQSIQAQLQAILAQGYVLAAQARAGGLIDPSWAQPSLSPSDAAKVRKFQE